MVELKSLRDIEALRETHTVECKRAAGKDGNGKLPNDFWETYSAFANKRGGIIILGLREKQRKFFVEGGVPNAAKVRDELFDLLNNRQKISANLLTDEHVTILSVDGKNILIVEVPKATRRQRPVYVDNRPFGGTYFRGNTGDRKCDDETVRRWLAEQTDEGRDGQVLPAFGLGDLAPETIERFRVEMAKWAPSHPFLKVKGEDFLRRIKAFSTDRETKASGLTVAGLLMFGRSDCIVDVFPNYEIDYREFGKNSDGLGDACQRRIICDGSWSGNLFDFYLRTYRLLIEDLKAPYVVKDGVRMGEDTPVHKSVQEALVNSIIHADYSGRSTVLIAKWPGSLLFRNPGTMRVPLEAAMSGGDSDCRNKLLQAMFFLAGAGDKQGAGVPRIFEGWASQGWTPPSYQDDDEKERTELNLRMVDLIQPDVLQKIQDFVGPAFEQMPAHERAILACTMSETFVTNARAVELTGKHTSEVTKVLQDLVKIGFLERRGPARYAFYTIPGTVADGTLPHILTPPTPPHPQQPPPRRGEAKTAYRTELEAKILAFCKDEFRTAREIADHLGHNRHDKVSERHIAPLVRAGQLDRLYPSVNPKQAYKTASKARQA